MYAHMDDLGHTWPPRGPPFREDPHGIVQLVEGFPLLKESVVSSVLPAKMNELTHRNCDLSPKNVKLTCINDDFSLRTCWFHPQKVWESGWKIPAFDGQILFKKWEITFMEWSTNGYHPGWGGGAVVHSVQGASQQQRGIGKNYVGAPPNSIIHTRTEQSHPPDFQEKHKKKTPWCFWEEMSSICGSVQDGKPMCLAPSFIPRCCNPVLTALQFIIFQRQWWKEFHLGEMVVPNSDQFGVSCLSLHHDNEFCWHFYVSTDAVNGEIFWAVYMYIYIYV